ncbi:MAG: TIGR02680 family protein [Burkholderiales bacterium]|nr:TIGR02680 family protein [Burkholderiales bacterium]
MTDALFESPLEATASERPPLPEPQRARWQPLRLGLVELFHYDSEEFWFRDGHLLLRGNNGTGKSKVLSLTLPFLFDAQLRPSRIEPDADNGKRMAWNLLMGSYQRRMGYSWIEFGRRDANGVAHYLTLGAGMSAVAGKAAVDSWFFLLEGNGTGADPRIGQDLWLTNDQKVVLTRERLREAVEGQGRGQVFDTAHNYRRAVDERLFHLGTKRYEALMDTLIQLRQPQLSKKPDEAGLSHALTEALPPMPPELLADVAEALNQLEEDRKQLDDTRQLEQAVKQFEQRYRGYAGTLTRRQARELRQAQSAFEKASEERNHTQFALQQAQADEAEASTALESAKRLLAAERERLQTLQSDPANQDANRLSQAEKDARDRQAEAHACTQQRDTAHQQQQREEKLSAESAQRLLAAQHELEAARRQCATDAEDALSLAALADNPLHTLAPEPLAALPSAQLASAATALHALANARRADIRLLEQRHAAVASRQETLHMLLAAQRERQSELEDAAEQRASADQAAQTAGDDLLSAWEQHCASLQQLRWMDAPAALEQLANWPPQLAGPNPAQAALAQAHADATLRHAARQAALDGQQKTLRDEQATLVEEQARLTAGHDAVPPAPTTRAPGVRAGRAGAPLWQVVDFVPTLAPLERAGLEAALQASGLLDAWIAPDGQVLDAAGAPLWDAHWQLRPTVQGPSLQDVLLPVLPALPDRPDHSPLTAALVASLLASVACAPLDEPTAEAWIALDGRYRLGTLSGAWHKPEAIYIGATARAQARQCRLNAIAARLRELATHDAALAQQFDALAHARQQAEDERRSAPSDDPLRSALLEAASAERAVLQARTRLDQSDPPCRSAEAALQDARALLERDATDLHLPLLATALPAIASAVDSLLQSQHLLVQAAREWRSAWPLHQQQQLRENEARDALAQREEALATATERAQTAQARYTTLHESVGLQVEQLRLQLRAAANAVEQADADHQSRQTAQARAGETRAVAATRADAAEDHLAERTAHRAQAVEHLQRFAQSSLLASALPDLEIPDHRSAWTIDPALQLARQVEKELSHIADDAASWDKIQRQVSQDLTELQRALSALGHQASSQATDWGFTVHIIYQNRPERPDALATHLADDIAQRSELLSAKEREVLENHLQAEIAAVIQQLLRAADKQVSAINDELHKRPTSTGVRYRLQWQALTLEEGAPVGLDIARERLLHTSSDLWSAEDRRVVGAMLQQQIVMERTRAEADTSTAGTSLLDQLARALDYRRWHRFRVQRQQDGQWRKLSGPASSGERALGLTVPLFAAISSFYGRGGSPLAPRLMLLDEAFAGIDDTARAHCMGLIREFDLDFVITSEREWACYAELPGVSICQLQRREGVDAVFVSRWNWDGRAKRRLDDPDRRFPAA